MPVVEFWYLCDGCEMNESIKVSRSLEIYSDRELVYTRFFFSHSKALRFFIFYEAFFFFLSLFWVHTSCVQICQWKMSTIEYAYVCAREREQNKERKKQWQYNKTEKQAVTPRYK